MDWILLLLSSVIFTVTGSFLTKQLVLQPRTSVLIQSLSLGLRFFPLLCFVFLTINFGHPILFLNTVLHMNVLLFLVVGILPLVFFSQSIMKRISKRFLYLLALFTYLYVVLLISFTKHQSSLELPIALPTILILIFFLLFLFMNSMIQKEKEITSHSRLTSTFFFLLFLFVLSNIGVIWFSFHMMNSIFLLYGCLFIPVLLGFRYYQRGALNYGYSFLLESNLLGLLSFSIYDLWTLKVPIYFASTSFTIALSQVAMFLSVLFMIPMLMKKKSNWIMILFCIASFLLYFCFIRPI